MESALELRILSGRQSGARLRLTPGEYSLGKAELCDIILTGRGVESLAAELDFGEDGLYLTPVQADCGLVGNEPCHETIELTAGQVFRLGDLWLAIDTEETPWPEQDSWLQLDQDVNDSDADELNDGIEDEVGDGAEVGTKPTLSGVLPAPEKNTAASPRLGIASTLAAVAMCVVVFSLGWLSVLVLRPTPAPLFTTPVAGNASANQEKFGLTLLGALISEFGYNERLMVQDGQNGQPLITGFLPNEQALTTLKNRFQEAKINATLHIKLDDVVKTQVDAFLKEARQPWTVYAVKNGTVLISGVEPTSEQAHRLLSDMRVRVPTLRAVKSVDKEAKDAYTALQRLLLTEKFTGRVNTTLEGTQLSLDGILGSTDISKMERLLLDLDQQYGDTIEIVANFPAPARQLPFFIKQIETGALPYIVTGTNVRIYEGGEHEGFHLISVRNRKLVFNGPQLVEIEY